MINVIAAAVLFLLAMGAVIARKTYFTLPVHELKRRAERRDPLARQLYRAVSYGSSLTGLLWVLTIAASAGGLVLLARAINIWLDLAVAAVLMAVVYVWLPGTRTNKLEVRVTAMVTPAIAWLLNYLFPATDRLANLLRRPSGAGNHTGLFEHNDLLDLIEKQSGQADNRVAPEDLETLKRALSFNDQHVRDIMTSARHIKTIQAGDNVGPILINELYELGQESVLVRDTAGGQVVGLLETKKLGLKASGTVRDVMDPAVHFLHENDSLGEALQAFGATNCPLFVVVNNAQEYVGVVSTQNLLRALLGELPDDGFDQYTDAAAVAVRHNPVVRPVSVTDAADEVVELA